MGDPYQQALAKADSEGASLPHTVEHLRASASAFLLKAPVDPSAAEKEAPFSFWGMGEANNEPAVPDYYLPSPYLPGFWPLFALGSVATLHALILLLQVWVVDIKCWVRYRPVRNVSEATHVRIVPRAFRGKKQLLPLEGGGLGTWFLLERRRYLYIPEKETFQKIRCKVDWPLAFFGKWRGFATDGEVMDAQERFGKNLFEITLPAFMDLYKQQLLSPFTVFQLFCVILWCLDSYWQYSVFTLFMIFSFEASVVMQRIKNLNVLKGMDNKVLDVLVFRNRRWEVTRTTELVPGDVFSLIKTPENDGIVPCDCLLLQGSTVVNEATLTGESIPQMKEALAKGEGEGGEVLDIKSGTGKVHVMFGGTRLLQVSAGGGSNTVEVLDDEERAEEGEASLHGPHATEGQEKDEGSEEGENGESMSMDGEGIPPPPDHGCVCYALRTGFSSSQGKLVRMIEGSTEGVRTDTRDTALLLLLLLLFAIAASGYVLKKGMERGDKSKYQLLLHCVLIVTSVIPPELPMQMALAVNSALLTLIKMQIFCTEPFRVPAAGKVDVCLFDKTGTLTTDELVAVGVTDMGRRGSESGRDGGRETEALGLTGMQEAGAAATVVLGACHALVLVDGKVAGDPIEAAALKEIKWEIVERSRVQDRKGGRPGRDGGSSAGMVTECRPLPAQTAARGPRAFHVEGFGPAGCLHIVARHHFSSKLQRMSVVVRAGLPASGTAVSGQGAPKALVLVKGSPEAIAKLLAPAAAASLPLTRYHQTAAHLAKEGMRVLALAYKVVEGKVEEVERVVSSRQAAESDLLFAGFVAFTCRVRRDTAAVVAQLKEGKHAVAMVTGDALLTAVHVAKQVGICRAGRKGMLILGVQGEGEEGGHEKNPGPPRIFWESYETGKEVDVAFDPEKVPLLARDYDLCTAGMPLAVASKVHPALRRHLEHFVVFARMTPDEKEAVITSLKAEGRVCMMCGDGANDVGALKQADVGVALLSGFGDLNVDRGTGAANDSTGATPSTSSLTAIMTKAQLEELQRMKPSEIKKKLRALGVAPEDHPQVVEKAELIRLYQAAVQRRAAKEHDAKNAREAAAGVVAAGGRKGQPKTPQELRAQQEKERREMLLAKQEELRKEMEERTAKGESFAMVRALMSVYQKEAAAAKEKRAKMAADSTLTASAAKMAAMMEEMDTGEGGGELPMVKVGDASVAAPFTSKMPSIRGTVDIIRQGRCTLVTTIQMYQILALTCLISSYSLSVLHLDGVKYGDYQMTALGILMSISFVTVSRAKPLERLSSVRPFNSIFHPALFFSILGQFALHLICMMLAVRESKKHLPPDFKIEVEGEFKANIINSVVFLVSAVQQVSVFVVNLKGPPFMSGLGDNSPLLYSLASTFVLTFLLASESMPQLNKFLQLVPFPTPGFRNLVLLLLAGDIACATAWDRLMTFIFAPHVLRASLEGLTGKDGVRMLKILVVITGVIWFLCQGDLDLEEFGGLMDGDAAIGVEKNETGSWLNVVVPPRPTLEGGGLEDGLDEFVGT